MSFAPQRLVAGLVCLAAGGWALIGCGTSRSSDSSGAAFFAGRTLTYIVGSTAGGGYDTYARLVAKYLDRYLPGVRVVVRNAPGAMMMLAANEVHDAKPDGLTIGTFAPGLIFPQLTGEPGVRFDLATFSWIGRVAAEPRVLAVSTISGVRTIDDLRNPSSTARIATGSVGNSGFFGAHIIREALGLHIGIVPGFDEQEAELLMVRGDVAGYIASPTAFRSLEDRGLARLILRVGDGPELEEFVPAAEELVTSPFGRALLSLVAVQAELSRPTAAPPGVPPDRLAALRHAYSSVLRDPDLIADARRLHLPIDPLDGAEVATRFARALAQPPEIVAWLRKVAER